jgi:hypothetical protein
MKIRIYGFFVLLFFILATASHANDTIYYAPDGSKINEAEYLELCKKKTEERTTLNKYLERSVIRKPEENKKDANNHLKNQLNMNDCQGTVSGKRNNSRLEKRKPFYHKSLEDNEKAIAEIRIKISEENNPTSKRRLLQELQYIEQRNIQLKEGNQKLNEAPRTREQARSKQKYETAIQGLKIESNKPENRNRRPSSTRKREMPKWRKLALLDNLRCTPFQVKVWDDENNQPGCIDKYYYETRIRNFYPEIKLPDEL